MADLNGDGKPDLIVANRDSNTVSVLLEHHPGGGHHAQLRRPADLRHRQQSILRGGGGPQRRRQARPRRGERGFQHGVGAAEHDRAGRRHVQLRRPADLRHRHQSAIVDVADLNGDGKPDLIVANENSNTVSVLLNTTRRGPPRPVFAPSRLRHRQRSLRLLRGGGGPQRRRQARPDRRERLLPTRCRCCLNTTAPGATTPSFAAQQTFATGT